MSIVSSSTKTKISNSFEVLLTGPTVVEIQKEYEIPLAIVIEYNKIHDSQSFILSDNNSTMSLVVYYEVPKGQLVEAVKQKFGNFTKNAVLIANRNWWIGVRYLITISIMNYKTSKTSPSFNMRYNF